MDDQVQYQFAQVRQRRENRHEVTYDLILRQQPKHSRMCGVGEKGSVQRADRRPVDPPPIIQLKVIDPALSPAESNSFLQNPYYFMYASLIVTESTEELHLLRDGRTRSTTGSVVSSLYHLKDIDNADAGFFVFPDLSVRIEGSYRLKFSLFEIVGKEVFHCKSICSDPFTVYSAKRFPGMEESTFLSRSFADQGLKIRIRKEIRIRRRTGKRKGSTQQGGASQRPGRPSSSKRQRQRSRDEDDASGNGSDSNDSGPDTPKQQSPRLTEEEDDRRGFQQRSSDPHLRRAKLEHDPAYPTDERARPPVHGAYDPYGMGVHPYYTHMMPYRGFPRPGQYPPHMASHPYGPPHMPMYPYDPRYTDQMMDAARAYGAGPRHPMNWTPGGHRTSESGSASGSSGPSSQTAPGGPADSYYAGMHNSHESLPPASHHRSTGYYGYPPVQAGEFSDEVSPSQKTTFGAVSALDGSSSSSSSRAGAPPYPPPHLRGYYGYPAPSHNPYDPYGMYPPPRHDSAYGTPPSVSQKTAVASDSGAPTADSSIVSARPATAARPSGGPANSASGGLGDVEADRPSYPSMPAPHSASPAFGMADRAAAMNMPYPPPHPHHHPSAFPPRYPPVPPQMMNMRSRNKYIDESNPPAMPPPAQRAGNGGTGGSTGAMNSYGGEWGFPPSQSQVPGPGNGGSATGPPPDWPTGPGVMSTHRAPVPSSQGHLHAIPPHPSTHTPPRI